MDTVVLRQGGFIRGHLLLPCRPVTWFRACSVLPGMTPAVDIVRGIKVCFVVTLSLSSPALSASRFMQGKFKSPEITAQQNQTLTPRLWLEFSVTAEQLSPSVKSRKTFDFFQRFVQNTQHLRMEAQEQFRCNPPGDESRSFHQQECFNCIPEWRRCWSGTAPLKCHVFFWKTFCCSEKVRLTFYCGMKSKKSLSWNLEFQDKMHRRASSFQSGVWETLES